MVSRSAKCYHIAFPLKFYKLYHIGHSFSKSFLPCEMLIIRENDRFKHSRVTTFQLFLCAAEFGVTGSGGDGGFGVTWQCQLVGSSQVAVCVPNLRLELRDSTKISAFARLGFLASSKHRDTRAGSVFSGDARFRKAKSLHVLSSGKNFVIYVRTGRWGPSYTCKNELNLTRK